MNVLHLTTYPHGGAWIAAQRLNTALAHKQQTSQLQTCADFAPEPDPEHLPVWFRCKRKTKHLLLKASKTTNPITRSCGIDCLHIVPYINACNADIIHLHWINDGLLSILDIAKIRKPLVWTMHDSWAFCGAEHHPNLLENDVRYQTGYNSANFPATSSGIDLDKWVWRWKKYCWKDLHCTFTAPSRWEAGCFESSALFRGQKCRVIPNCLNQRIYAPVDRLSAKQKWELPPDKKILLFGAQMSNNPIKGGQYLKAALKSLAQKRDDLFLLCFGAGNDADFQDYGIPYRFTGSLSGDEVLASVYQAADVFICPSVVESFGQTALEAISCGVPVAAFNATGIPDIVRHQENGYLAQPYEPDDLGNGILYCLENHDILSTQARAYAETHFSEKKIAEQFIELYQEVLDRS